MNSKKKITCFIRFSYLQISAVLANSEIMDCFTPGTHGSTYGGNPLACKIAMTALDVIFNENMIENSAKMGEIFRIELSKRLDKTKAPVVRGRGLLNAVVLNSSKFFTSYFELLENYLCLSINIPLLFHILYLRMTNVY